MTAQVLAALFGGAAAGAVLNSLFSLFTGWLGRRHEHRRWILEKRLEVYVDLLNGWHTFMSAAPESREDRRKMHEEWFVVYSRSVLIGSPALAARARDVKNQIRQWVETGKLDPVSGGVVGGLMLSEMQEDLRLTKGPGWRRRPHDALSSARPSP